MGTLALLANGCSMTLDPTLSSDEGVRGDTPGLAVCSVFQHETREYELCPEPLTWPAAEHDCSLRGALLASVETETENDSIHAAALLVGTNVWLGGSRDDDLVWAWATGQIFWQGAADGGLVDATFARWAPGEPNNSSTVSPDSERCLVLTLQNADWNDRVCNIALPYVCERPLEEN